MRSLNVTLRQKLDLYVCLRPVRYYDGTPSPVKAPEKTDMVIFRENSEDIYAGIEWAAGSDGVKKVIDFLQNEMGVSKIRFPDSSGIGINRSRRRAPSAWYARQSSTSSTMTVIRSPWYTRAIS